MNAAEFVRQLAADARDVAITYRFRGDQWRSFMRGQWQVAVRQHPEIAPHKTLFDDLTLAGSPRQLTLGGVA